LRSGIHYFRDLLVLAGLIALAGLPLSFAFYGSVLPLPGLLHAYGLISSGPVGGWLLGAEDHSVGSALWSLLPLTLLTFGPLVIAAWYPSRRVPLFVIAGFFWLSSGILYGVAIWI
jgi:hypothetical protein